MGEGEGIAEILARVHKYIHTSSVVSVCLSCLSVCPSHLVTNYPWTQHRAKKMNKQKKKTDRRTPTHPSSNNTMRSQER
jgi:L-lactate utilization protein LutB